MGRDANLTKKPAKISLQTKNDNKINGIILGMAIK